MSNDVPEGNPLENCIVVSPQQAQVLGLSNKDGSLAVGLKLWLEPNNPESKPLVLAMPQAMTADVIIALTGFLSAVQEGVKHETNGNDAPGISDSGAGEAQG